MRYTFHAGYEPPGLRPQFLASLASTDPAAHVRHAAAQGMAGILYPWAMDRPPDEIAAVEGALADTGLVCSCIVSADSSVLFKPIWCDRFESSRQQLAEMTRRACKIAVGLKSGVLAAFVMVGPDSESDPLLRDKVAANLYDMADLAAEHGLALGIEPMRLPGLMFQSVESTLDVIGQVGHPALGIIYDTAHVAAMEGALMPAFLSAFDHLVLLQLADLPGRVEPGAGTLDIVAVAAQAIRGGYTGLVDFEHGWTEPSAEGEAAGLRHLRAFDNAVQAATSQRGDA